MFDELLRELQAGVFIMLALLVGGMVIVFVLTQLHEVLKADLTTPLVVVGVAVFVLIAEVIKHQRRQS
jgi:hypothetical protein